MPVKLHASDKLVPVKMSILVSTDTCNKHIGRRGYQHRKNKTTLTLNIHSV